MTNNEPSKEPASKPSPLIGRYFYTTKGGKIEHRGQIMHKINDSHYLVDLLRFYPCSLLYQRIYDISEMKGWLLYESMTEMDNSLNHGVASRMKP
jgi:hypothetical protein